VLSGTCRVTWHSRSGWPASTADRQGPALRRVTLTDGRHGLTYIWAGPTHAQPHDWEIGTFERDHLTDFLELCATWRRRYVE